MAHRAPAANIIQRGKSAGLRHVLLATTPEFLIENQPCQHPSSDCVITADVRPDNRDELLAGTENSGNTNLAEAVSRVRSESFCLKRGERSSQLPRIPADSSRLRLAQVGVHHAFDELLETDVRGPSQNLTRLRCITE